jgi:hypothetical protein
MLQNSNLTSVNKLVTEMASIKGDVAALKMKQVSLEKTVTQQNDSLNVLKKKVK